MEKITEGSTASDALKTIVRNNGVAAQWRLQLIDLQKWVREIVDYN